MTDHSPAVASEHDTDALLSRIAENSQRIRADLATAIVGMEEVTDLLLGAILAGGHCLLEGVPGLAKTLLVKSLGQTLGLDAARIQFTPDLMPNDITGAEVIHEDKHTGERIFRFIKGPIFTNLLLADEINRTPPKTQAALMEAMEERQVTSLGKRRALDDPFLVVATQNPIEQEATYPLPAAQLDRFMYLVKVDYPSYDEEYRIIRQTTTRQHQNLKPILSADEIRWLQEAVRNHPVSESLEKLVVRLTRMTRPTEDIAPKFIHDWIAWGAGPRADQCMISGAKSRALLRGRTDVRAEDVVAVSKPVLRHRICLNYQAEADNVAADEIIDRLLREIPEFAAVLEAAEPEEQQRGFFARLFGRKAVAAR